MQKGNEYDKGNKYIEHLKEIEGKEVEITVEGQEEPIQGKVLAVNWYYLNIVLEEEGKITIIKNPSTIREL